MKAVVTVIGVDKVGIIAMASAECAKHGANIIDISQTVMREYFSMIMLVEIDGINIPFAAFVDRMSELGHSWHRRVLSTPSLKSIQVKRITLQ